MTTAQVVETSVTVNNNSPIQDCVHPDDQTPPTYEMTPGFKPFTEELYVSKKVEENARASEGKLIMPTRNNNRKKSHYVCYNLTAWKKSGKNHICSV